MMEKSDKAMYAKCFSRLGLLFLAGTAVILCAQNLVVWAVEAWKPQWLENQAMLLMFSVLPMYLIGMPVLIGLVKKMPGTAPAQHTMKAWEFLVALPMCYAVMYLSNLVGVAITGILGAIKGAPISNDVMDIATNGNMAVNAFYMVLCAPILEEYVFRKLIIDRTLRFGQGVAILVSGLMFGLFHGNISQFVYATALGFFFGFIYVKTGKLKYCIGLHMFINFFGAVISVLVLKGIKYEEFLLISESGDAQALMAFVMNNLVGFLAYMLYLGFIVVMVIAGVVLFIVYRKRLVMEPGEETIPKGKRFSAIFLNFGMAVYCLFWIAMMVLQILQ